MNGQKATGKQRASRIPLDYYKKGDPLTHRKAFWTRIALLATAVWFLIVFPASFIPGLDRSPVGLDRYSHGAVCRVHQAIGHECSACHVNFPMLSGRVDLADAEKGGRSTFAGDLKCAECHLGVPKKGDSQVEALLAVHHPTLKVSMTPNCGTCHKDHKGVNHDLKRVADANCTSCHKTISASIESTAKYAREPIQNVTSFHGDHPEFRSLKRDPSTIKFNHKYHTVEGIVLTKEGKPFTVGEMEESGLKTRLLSGADRPRGLRSTDAVRLVCADCHTPENRDDRAWEGNAPVADVSKKTDIRDAFAKRRGNRQWDAAEGVLEPPHKPGAYMAPVNYDRHCAACHKISLGDRGVALPHPGQLVRSTGKAFDLNDYLDTQVLTHLKAPPRGIDVPFTLPGLRPPDTGPIRRPTLLAPLLGGKEDVQQQASLRQAARHLLFSGHRACGECHTSAAGIDLSESTEKIAYHAIPKVWLKHAKFDHSQHNEARGMNCNDCHSQAFGGQDYKEVLAASMLPRKGAEEVMMPQKKDCLKCHSPTPDPQYASRGLAAKFDCTECHTYHQGVPSGGNQRAGASPDRRREQLDDVLLRLMKK
jgi:hypothetical protein